MATEIPADIKRVFDSWPTKVQAKAMELRTIIHGVSAEIRHEHSLSSPLEETLKWGEPAFILKTGSTLRMGYREHNPDTLSLFFICNTNLVDTFRELHGDQLTLIDNREMQIPISNTDSDNIIEGCIRKTLEYHKLKHLPLLGG